MPLKNVKDCNEYRDLRNRNAMQLQMSWVLGSVLVYTQNGWISASLAKSADFSDVMHAAKSSRLAGTVQLLCVDTKSRCFNHRKAQLYMTSAAWCQADCQ